MNACEHTGHTPAGASPPQSGQRGLGTVAVDTRTGRSNPRSHDTNTPGPAPSQPRAAIAARNDSRDQPAPARRRSSRSTVGRCSDATASGGRTALTTSSNSHSDDA